MSVQSLKDLFFRDIPKLNEEIEAYSSEELIWRVAPGTNNSAGNLSLHIAGNLRYFFGSVLGDSDYQRTREYEFSGKASREELLRQNREALDVVINALNSMEDHDLDNEYPLQVFGKPMTTGFFCIHLHSHLMYHLGQINYHRRMLDL